MKDKFYFDFRKFLMKHKVYQIYIYNVENGYVRGRMSSVKELFSNEIVETWISNAFTWAGTEQGYDFWHNLDILWRMYLCSKI